MEMILKKASKTSKQGVESKGMEDFKPHLDTFTSTEIGTNQLDQVAVHLGWE